MNTTISHNLKAAIDTWNPAVAEASLNDGDNAEGTVNSEGVTALMFAAFRGYDDLVHLLLTYGASPLTTDVQGRTALHHAVRGCKTLHTARYARTYAQLLEYGADAEQPDAAGQTPLGLESSRGNRGLHELWAAEPERRQRVRRENDLGDAARKGDTDRVRALLQAGVAPDPAEQSVSALMAACGEGHRAIVELLLEAGADINHRNSAYETPLHYAVWSKDAELIRLLLERGADPMIGTREKGSTPYVYAAWNNYTEIAELLRQAMEAENKAL